METIRKRRRRILNLHGTLMVFPDKSNFAT
jgi:hypothetical protein